MIIRNIKLEDRLEWARMRDILWPDSYDDHLHEIDAFLNDEKKHLIEVFVVERDNGKLGGFLELNLRNYAEGTTSVEVPYLEGWFVEEDLRRNGYGKKLMKEAEKWVLANNYTELASDAKLKNDVSIVSHIVLGFKEVERIVCFIKPLK